MIFAVFLGCGSAFALGCGSKPQPAPEQPTAALTPDNNSNPPRVDPGPVVKATYELDPAKHVIPSGPVTGQLVGVPVTAEVTVEGLNLVLRKPSDAPGAEWRVAVELPAAPGREGSPAKMVVGPNDELPGTTAWTVFAELPKPVPFPAWEVLGFRGWRQEQRLGWRGGCSITLEWGKRENSKIAGKVYLALPDVPDAHPDTPTGSFLAGTFLAECPRQAGDPPGTDDLPYVSGTVNLTQPAPGANLRVGYVGSLGMDRFSLGAATADLDGGQQVLSNYDKPHITRLIAGDGKMSPSRYEHSKLTPGRYLVFANVRNGPIAWKWIEVKASEALKLDLTIDAGQVGGLDVAPPLEALGKVQLAPADEANQPPPSDALLQGIALQMGLEADIVARKAKFTNLAPGRYIVRAAGQSRTVEIAAGKTVELDFDKK
jgi:hypothetical protein